MRKRLRKKQRLGEFQEFGFRVRIVTASGLTKAERDWLLWDGWVLGFVETSGLLFGGGGLRDWDGYVTSAARRGSATEHHRQAAAGWLASQPGVARYEVFPLTDAWHGDPWAAGSARDSLNGANGSAEPGVGADSR